jgi:hypothetical protein
LTPTETNPCSICAENTPNWICLPCKHAFCGKCVHDMHSRNISCPNCQKEISDAMKFFL